MNAETIKEHLRETLKSYMREQQDLQKPVLLQDVFLDENKEVYRLLGIIR